MRGVMMSKAKQQKKNRFLLPLILVAFIPLIMYYHGYDTKLDSYPWFGRGTQADAFLYYKMVAMILLAVVMMISLLGYFYTLKISSASKLKKQKDLQVFYSYKTWIPLMVYAILCLLSTVFSKFSYWGYHGITQQMESVWVLLGYVILTYYGYVFVRNADDIRTIIKWLLISSGIVCLIGAFQAFGLDFYKSIIGKYTYLPSMLVNEEMEFNFEKGRTYSSLYNPNYVGVYASLLLPIIIVLILGDKNRKMLVAYLPLLAAVVISLFGSNSKSGILCIAVSLLLFLVLFRKQVLEKWKIVLVGVLLLCIAFFGVNALKGNALISSLKNALSTTQSKAPALSKIETNDNNVTVVYNGNKLVFQFVDNANSLEEQLSLTDGSGEKIAVSEIDDATLSVLDERFPNFTVGLATYQDLYYVDINIDGKAWYFTNQSGDNTYKYLTIVGKLDKIEQPEFSNLFIGKETLASNRGFIWSRTLPLLKKYVFLGSGADSFLLVYPNDEYVGKYNYGYGDQNITKPHNLYLQIAVQTGVVSMIAFLVFYLLYFVTSIRLYMKSKLLTYETQIGAAILVGTFGYMLMGLSNDSCIAVAPIFWLLIGIAINYRLKNGQFE